jgi:hypothetical protein
MFRKYIFLCISFMFVANSAHAALLTNIQGSVLVNKGEGFELVEIIIGVQPGDRILVRGNSSADIVYDTGCTVSIAEHQMIVVRHDDNCGSAAAFTGSLKDSLVEQPVEEVDNSGLVIGGLIVAGGTVAVINSGGDKKNKPVSP